MPRTSRPRKGSTGKTRSTSGAEKATGATPKKPRTKRPVATEGMVVTASHLPETEVPAMTAPVAPAPDPASPPSGQVSVEFPSEAFPGTARVPVVGEATGEPRAAAARGPAAGEAHAAEKGASAAARPPASAKPHLEAEDTPGAPSGGTEAAPSRAPRVEVEDGPRYLYGVVRAAGNLDFGLIGLGAPPADVRAVREGDLAALVSTSPALVVDPTRSHLLVHQRVTEAVLREHTLLPVAFGTVLRSEAQVRTLLRTAHDALSSALAALEGKVELGLKVLYHREHLARRLELEDAQLSRQDGEPEADHERRLGAAVEVRAAQDMASLLEGLRPLARASRTSPPVGDRMLLNAAFLVEREAVPAFEAKVKSLAARSDIYAFRFTGPWAPYSFVDVHLGLELEPDTAA